MRAPSDWVTCWLLLPRWHLSHSVKLEACVPITPSQTQMLPHLKTCAEKSSFTDFISDSDGMDDSWFADIKEHTPDRHWETESSRISNTVQWLFPKEKFKFAQFENSSWRKWQQLKEFGWKLCYPLIHPQLCERLLHRLKELGMASGFWLFYASRFSCFDIFSDMTFDPVKVMLAHFSQWIFCVQCC